MQYKRILLVSSALSVLALAACTPAVTPPTDGSSSSSSVKPTPAASSAAAASKGSNADARVVNVAVTDWSFTPAIVTVKKGEKVQMRLTGGTGVHGLLVAGLGINVRVTAGAESLVTIPTDTAGTFEGKCNVPCGPGHRDMTFAIVVE